MKGKMTKAANQRAALTKAANQNAALLEGTECKYR